MAKRNDDDDRDQQYDPRGEHGGDTGHSAPITGGEKGDQRLVPLSAERGTNPLL